MGKRVHVVKKREEYGDTQCFNWMFEEWKNLLGILGAEVHEEDEYSDRWEVETSEYENAMENLKLYAKGASMEKFKIGVEPFEDKEQFEDWKEDVKTALAPFSDVEYVQKCMKELYDAAVEAGATVLPGVSTDGYTYDDSEAIDGDKFLGLALDEVNEDDKTEVRIDAWLEAIKPAL